MKKFFIIIILKHQNILYLIIIQNLKKIKKLNLPCVIKPIDSFGQKGVNKIENFKILKKLLINQKNIL